MLRSSKSALQMFVVFALTVGASLASAQTDSGAKTNGGAFDKPTEIGVRFTPGMARGIGRMYAEEVLKTRYEMEDEQLDTAADLIANRLMEMVHQHEEQLQGLSEYYMTEAMELMADAREGKRELHGVPTMFAQGFAKHAGPMLPGVRDLIKNVGQDIRPLLPMKQQLKLGADLMMVHKGVDAFEETMKRWSEGDVDPFDNPFDSGEEEVELDENGESKELKQARERAEKVLDPAGALEQATKEWERYVTKAKELYGFDETQSALADSILRETKERAELTVNDPGWRDRAYRNRLWHHMSHALPGRWQSPLRNHLEEGYEELNAPIEELGEDLMRRVDKIPTTDQRALADERIAAILAERGWDLENEDQAESTEETP